MTRRRRTTTEQGLGADHQRRRRETPVPFGMPCPFFGVDPKCPGLLLPGQRLQFDHATPRAFGGDGTDSRWAHGRCNEAAGARLRNARRRGMSQLRRWTDQWA